ncbi:MAG: hypothetical protein JXQ96_22910 [Cyclobacteriaceae bacterium]
MKNLILQIAIAGALIFGSTNASAQASDQPSKYENPEWKSVVYVDFKSGKYGRAKEIVDKYYLPASKKSGTPGPEMVLEMRTGEWDLMIIWGFEGGISDMDWKNSPNNIAWTKALNELAGGADKAKAIREEYSGLISRSSSQIGKIR